MSLYTEFIFILISNQEKSREVTNMRKILFLLSIAFAEVVWTCDHAAELCLTERIFIPAEEICQDQTCLNLKKDLCDDHELFKNGEYDQFFCEEGIRSPHQVIWY